MPKLLKGTLNPCVSPRRILLGHLDDQATDLGEHDAAAGLTARVGPLPRNQLAVPAQQRVRGDDRGDLAQPLTAYAVRPYSKPAPVLIGQLQTPPCSWRRRTRFSSTR